MRMQRQKGFRDEVMLPTTQTAPHNTDQCLWYSEAFLPQAAKASKSGIELNVRKLGGAHRLTTQGLRALLVPCDPVPGGAGMWEPPLRGGKSLVSHLKFLVCGSESVLR